MSIMFVKTAQIGEWWEVGARCSDNTTATSVPLVVTGKTVDLTVRTGPNHTDPIVSVDGVLCQVVDGPSGIVSVGGRIATAGMVYATVSIGTSADGPGWPVKEMFVLKITECP